MDLNHDALGPDGFHDFRMFEGCEPVTNTGSVEQDSVHKVHVSGLIPRWDLKKKKQIRSRVRFWLPMEHI